MKNTNEREINVASIHLTPEESALISAYCRLARTKVAAVLTDLSKYFIQYHVKLELLNPPTHSEMESIVKNFTKIDDDKE